MNPRTYVRQIKENRSYKCSEKSCRSGDSKFQLATKHKMTLDLHRNSYCIARCAAEDESSTTENNDYNNNIDIK